MSSSHSDEVVLELLEKAVSRAELSLTKTQSFEPFAMTLGSESVVNIVQNSIDDTHDSYAMLGEELRTDIDTIDVLVLAVDTIMPEHFAEGSVQSIRLHLEERSLAGQKLSARFIFVPYTLHRMPDSGDIYVRLGTPNPVAFSAEYLI